jgi:hypothetical protein
MKTRWAVVMALAAISVLPSACMAQYRDYGYDRNHRDVSRTAYDRGYEDGVRHGRVDGRRHERYAYRDERAYRKADSGYHRSYGSRSRYSTAYRQGFERGYRRAFDVERRTYRSGSYRGGVGKSDTYDDDYAVEKDDRRRY